MRIESPPSIQHPDVFLRQLEKSDLEDWFAYLSMPQMTRDTSWTQEAVNNLEVPLRDYLSTNPDSPIRLAIVDKLSGKLIGTAGFHTIFSLHKTAEITYDLSPVYWGKGIASAVCRTMTEWGFSKQGWVRIQAAVLETNMRSEKVLVNCGYTFEGVLRSFRMVRGKPGNFKMFSRIHTD